MYQAPGEHGGRVLRRFSGAGRTWEPGEQIEPALATTWTPRSRQGLGGAGYVAWSEHPPIVIEPAVSRPTDRKLTLDRSVKT